MFGSFSEVVCLLNILRIDREVNGEVSFKLLVFQTGLKEGDDSSVAEHMATILSATGYLSGEVKGVRQIACDTKPDGGLVVSGRADVEFPRAMLRMSDSPISRVDAVRLSKSPNFF